jgi:tetratricopeptide (TPR) repeat protein
VLQLIVVVLTVAVVGMPAPQRQAATQHARAGWDALHAGRAREAAAAFDAALKGALQEPSVLMGAALAAHLLGQSDAARRFLVDALRIDPALTPASQLLGEVLYRAGDIAGAIQTYDQALVHARANRQLTTKVEAWRREAGLHERFTQKLGDHFTVLFEGPAEAELAQKAVDVLEAAYWRIGSALYTYPAEPITVILYTREQFRDVTQSPDWAGGAYDGRIRVPVHGAMKNVTEFERVLTHEFTHALVKTIAPRGVPQWLNEGLAMYFESPHLTRASEPKGAAESKPPLATLEGSFAGMDAPAAARAYAQSAAAVKLLMEDAGAGPMVGILTDLARGLAFQDAFERNTHIAYSEFQKRVGS